MTDYMKEEFWFLSMVFPCEQSLSLFTIELLPRLNLQMAVVSGSGVAWRREWRTPCWQVNSQPDSHLLAGEKRVLHGKSLEIEMTKPQSMYLLRYLVTCLDFFHSSHLLFVSRRPWQRKGPSLGWSCVDLVPAQTALASKSSGLRGQAGAGPNLLIFQLRKWLVQGHISQYLRH